LRRTSFVKRGTFIQSPNYKVRNLEIRPLDIVILNIKWKLYQHDVLILNLLPNSSYGPCSVFLSLAPFGLPSESDTISGITKRLHILCAVSFKATNCKESYGWSSRESSVFDWIIKSSVFDWIIKSSVFDWIIKSSVFDWIIKSSVFDWIIKSSVFDWIIKSSVFDWIIKSSVFDWIIKIFHHIIIKGNWSLKTDDF